MAGSIKTRNVFLSIFAVGFLLIAALLIAKVALQNEDVLGSHTEAPETTDVLLPTEDYTGEAVSGKFLWQYGEQQVLAERPSMLPTVKTEPPSTISTTAVFMTEFKTNAAGELVTDEDGNPVVVTVVPTIPHSTVAYSKYVTDVNGFAVTDAAGNAITEVITRLIATTKVQRVTDVNGSVVTGSDGTPITEVVAPSTEAPQKTSGVVGSENGTDHWVKGISNGEKYTAMKVFIRGGYTEKRYGVITVGITQQPGNAFTRKVSSLQFNISNGNCRASVTTSYPDSVSIDFAGDTTIITLKIPEAEQPIIDQTTVFSCYVRAGLFVNENGVSSPEFTTKLI